MELNKFGEASIEAEEVMPRSVLNIVCDGEFKPKYGSEHAAGIDLYNNDKTLYFEQGQKHNINTLIKVEIHDGLVGLLFVRSSVGRRGFTLANTVGVIDSDYRGYIKADLVYNGNEEVEVIEQGERILQLVLVPHASFDLKFVRELSETERGEGGFGSSGKQ